MAKIQLIEQIEDNRWFVKWLTGKFAGLIGDYRLIAKQKLNQDAVLTVVAGGECAQPTTAQYCGKLQIAYL